MTNVVTRFVMGMRIFIRAARLLLILFDQHYPRVRSKNEPQAQQLKRSRQCTRV